MDAVVLPSQSLEASRLVQVCIQTALCGVKIVLWEPEQ